MAPVCEEEVREVDGTTVVVTVEPGGRTVVDSKVVV
jgi:hypothetical protein